MNSYRIHPGWEQLEYVLSRYKKNTFFMSSGFIRPEWALDAYPLDELKDPTVWISRRSLQAGWTKYAYALNESSWIRTEWWYEIQTKWAKAVYWLSKRNHLRPPQSDRATYMLNVIQYLPPGWSDFDTIWRRLILPVHCVMSACTQTVRTRASGPCPHLWLRQR